MHKLAVEIDTVLVSQGLILLFIEGFLISLSCFKMHRKTALRRSFPVSAIIFY